VPRLPDHASLEHLKGQAKANLKRLRAGDAETAAEFARHHPDPPAAPKLADAQLALARAYGFASWPRLFAHLETVERYSWSPHTIAEADDPVDEFLRLACLNYGNDDPARWEAARAMLAANPELARASLHAAAAAGDADATRALLAAASDAAMSSPPHRAGSPPSSGDAAPSPRAASASSPAGDAAPSSRTAAASPAAALSLSRAILPWSRASSPVVAAVNAPGGLHRWPPLMYLAYSRAGGDRAVEVARLLLAAGADANAGYLWDGMPSPFTVLTGVLGHGEGDPPAHRDALALARLLLEAGAEPTDAQAVYNLHWTPGDEWLELLLEFGFGRGDGGPWRARLAPELPPPDVIAEDALMWAAGHGFAHRVQLLLEAGVPPDRMASHPVLRRRTPLEQALLQGHADVVAVLRAAGAREPELDERAAIEAAYMRGDGRVTAPPPPGLIVRAADNRRADVVRLLLARGADVDALAGEKTALHAAAWNDDGELVDLLLEHGADPTIPDERFNATPAGWADHHGHAELAQRLRVLEG
jgi:ankyrin repeat protein